MTVEFRTHPSRYRHWSIEVEGPVATLRLEVDEHGGIGSGYELKLNSYDLGVDIELHDAVQRLRFEHPEVGAVVITSARDRVFSAGANIRMLGRSGHSDKVNFCKFTNETRNAIEDACTHSGQRYLAALNGAAAGGGYELALACDWIMLVDDGSSAVSLPEVPLLGVLPGTGGLTRVVDKRKVRRDHADFFCTVEEGVRGRRALDWRLVDELAPRSRFAEAVGERAEALAAGRPPARGIAWPDLECESGTDTRRYRHVEVTIDRTARTADLLLRGPERDPPPNGAGIEAQGTGFWPLALARELDDAILWLRHNELEIGTWLLRSRGDLSRVLACDELLDVERDHWLAREVRLFWKRILKRLDVVGRSQIALVEPWSCFVGTLLELVLGADRAYMLRGDEYEERPVRPAQVALGPLNFGDYPAVNGLTRLAMRYPEEERVPETLRNAVGRPLDAEAADAFRIVTFTPDDIDWEDEVRVAVEERSSFSPDALVGMEASLRFPGPETMESKIFGRLSAWQNWIFQRPNAVGERGALMLYGTGRGADFDRRRV
ncbi:MAG: 2,3-epoxybenzoyl-CoA dihydrolase [Immundisolibacterales bacterium]|nr:2,3-epoxybenzoyl-CoA dihydrolase [Immundisolibacterales bacterium]